MKTLIIDNYDSFTFNLYQMIAEINGTDRPLVVTNDQLCWEDLRGLDFDNIVISPGPGRPDNRTDFGVCRDALLKADVPLLGVCLGHQGIGHICGGNVIHALEPMHGRLSRVYHDGSALFENIPQGFMVVRYHSLMVANDIPACLQTTAWTADGVLMGLCHRERPLYGVQFHPESICTEYGKQLLQNFRDITHRYKQRREGVPIFKNDTADKVYPQRPVEGYPATHRGFGACEVRSRKLNHSYDPERVFVHLFGGDLNAFWLDSSRISPGLSRFSFIGRRGPYGLAVSYRSETRELTIDEAGGSQICRESIFDYLDEELNRRQCKSDNLPFDFNCGFVGYFGYELKGECGAKFRHSSTVPDAMFMFADSLIAFDHQEGTTYLLCLVPEHGATAAEAWLEDMAQSLEHLPPLPPLISGMSTQPPKFHFSRSREAYLDDIAKCKHYICEGESYEICLTNNIYSAAGLDPLSLYRTLRRVNPAPNAAFLRFGDLTILSSSPERFLRIDRNGAVESKPIKGTRPRGRNDEEDRALREHLRTSEKDRAENLMIVDLIRNDLGHVCEIGSIHVPTLMDVETYETVHQLVSTIRGRLLPHKSAIDCIRSSFPGGSMTGAPKLRTMEILDSLETEARGIYSGAIGFLGLNGATDLSIVIRTIVMTPASTSIGVGGAIVSLSDAESEYQEMLLKARALIQAIVLTATGESPQTRGDYVTNQLSREVEMAS